MNDGIIIKEVNGKNQLIDINKIKELAKYHVANFISRPEIWIYPST